MKQITLKGRVIVEGRCKAEVLVVTKPLDYFVDEAVIQPSRLHALTLHISKPNIRHKTLKMTNGIPTENLQFNLYIMGVYHHRTPEPPTQHI